MKRIVLLSTLLIFTVYIQAAEVSPKYLFINSIPMRAKVLVDGVDKGYLTPCILRNLSSAQKKITVMKDGYKNYDIDLSKVEEKKIEASLTPSSFDLYFPERSLYKIGNTQMKGPVYVSKLKSGNYEIAVQSDKIAFAKSSSFLPAEIAIGTSLGISIIFMIATIALSEHYRLASASTLSTFDSRYYDLVSRGFDIGKYVAVSTTSVLTLALSSVIIADLTTRQFDKRQKIDVDNKTPGDRGKTLYDTSLQFLSMGEIEKSTKIMESLISIYPDSEYIPLVYYQLGQNYFVLQEYESALKNWQIFIQDYPLADYYDYVLKNIAEIYYMNKDYRNAINMLDKMVFTENILDRETMFSFKAKLDYEMYLSTKTDMYYKLAVNDYMTLINDAKSSERLDFYYKQLINLYNMVGDTDKLMSLKKKAQEIQEPSVKQLILSYFEKK